MQERYQKTILRTMQDETYRPVKLSKLAKDLGIIEADYVDFKEACDQLREAGHIILGAGNTMNLRALTSHITGTFRANAKGFGFVIPRDPNAHGDLFIPPNDVEDAMTGDMVVAEVVRKGRRGSEDRVTGRIVKILERAQQRLVGTLINENGAWLVKPDGSANLDPIQVDDITAKQAQAQDKVVVEIVTYPRETSLARGVILEVLGKAGCYASEIQSIIRQFHLPGDFDEVCQQQASQAGRAFDPEQATGREDLSDTTILTIDPPDAKDFDDAISLTRTPDNRWELGVHIADVSHFVPAGSPLDEEAQARGNSVYLPGRVIPMLPEVLSNGVCSLQPQQKRFAKSAYITYDDQGKILKRRYVNSIIFSAQRLTYLQADAALKGGKHDLSPSVFALLQRMETLSRIIEARRQKQGMLHLDLPEIELETDADGMVTGAHPADDCYPHTMIEMFMVEANEAVASLLDRLNITFMRRVHPAPDPLSLKNLAKLVKVFGFNLGRNPDRHDLQNLLQAAAGQENALAISLSVLRSLEKAEYAPRNIGHFALASTCYGHFTSPIRRYADLLIHRQLQYYLEDRVEQAKQATAALDLAEIGSHISTTERNAEQAERELRTVLILQYLSSHLGDEFDGVVTGITGYGAFVQSPQFGIEGLVRIADLGSEHWEYNRQAFCLVGQSSGHTLVLGQALRVRITSVDVPGRQLNLVPAQTIDSGSSKRRRAPGPRKSTHKPNHRRGRSRRR